MNSNRSAISIALSQPLYRRLRPRLLCPQGADPTFERDFASIYGAVSKEDVTDLLAWKNWRLRLVGAYLAGLKNWPEFSTSIEQLLVQDELIYASVAYASVAYAFAIARFALPTGSTALAAYLWNNFSGRCTDMSSIPHAIAALKWIDARNGSNFFERNIGEWHEKIESGRATLRGSKREESRDFIRKVVGRQRLTQAENDLQKLMEVARKLTGSLDSKD